ncbi:MAG: peptide-methionine (S)-S-oxide reductase MsrA [Bacteroidales bacterium]
MYAFLLYILLFTVIRGSGHDNNENIYMKPENKSYETITLGAGCFWCVEAIFERLDGVKEVQSGYSGGQTVNPTYREVTSGLTGHAEVVQVTYDPAILPFARLLEVFFMTHDPTTLNRQGADVGTQYRSAIFYHNQEQRRVAEEVKSMLVSEKIWDDPIVTEITPYSNFYKAESYHQEYYRKNPNQGYCRMVIAPKLEKFENLFEEYIIDN